MIPQFLFCIRQCWLVHLLSVSYLFLFSLVLSIFFQNLPRFNHFLSTFFSIQAAMMRNAAEWFQSQALTLSRDSGFGLFSLLFGKWDEAMRGRRGGAGRDFCNPLQLPNFPAKSQGWAGSTLLLPFFFPSTVMRDEI